MSEAPLHPTHREYLAIAALTAVQMAATGLLFYPGILTYDSVLQYREAVSGQFTTIHPPLMAAVWRLLLYAGPGPLPMLLLDQLLYWGSFAVLAIYCVRRVHRWTAVIAALAGLWPLLLNFSGIIWKDVMLASAWGLSCALMLLATQLQERRLGFRVLACASGLLLVFGAAMRHNAAPAGIVLALAFTSVFVRGRARQVAAFLFMAACVTLAVPLSGRLLHAHDSQPVTNVVSWDLTGISYFSGHDYRSDLSGGPNADLHCYSPRLFDACPVAPFASTGDAVARWKTAIEREPVAYLKHRSLVFAMLLRFGCRNCQPSVAPPGLGTQPNFALRAFRRFTVLFGRTPLGRPYLWLTAAFGLAALLWKRAEGGERAILSLVPLSGAAYAFSYFPSAVTDEFRYIYWLIYSVVLAGTVYLLGMRIVFRDLLRWVVLPMVCMILVNAAIVAAAPTDGIAPSMKTNY